MKKSTAVTFTKASDKVLLEKGTYIIKPEPYFNLNAEETISGKMYTLTANDTYGEQTSFDSISLVKKEPCGLGAIFIFNSTDLTIFSCGGSEWKYLNTDGEEFTLSENTQTTLKIRTIVLETDQYVSQEFYNWVTTQGNFTKDGEQEKYRLMVAIPSIEASINGTKITEYPYILKDNDIILFENKADTSSTTRGIQIFYIENNVQTSIRTHNGVSSGTISNSDVTVSNDNQNSTTIYDFTLTFKQQESTGETWVLNSTIAAPSNSIDENINFLCVDTSQNFIRILVESEGKGVHLEYFAQGDSSTSGTGVLTGGTEVATKYRTLTFETAPTGALLTWLQANGTKQGGTNTFTQVEVTLTKPFKSGAKINSSDATFGRISNMDKTKIYSIKDIAGEYSQIAYITHNGSLWVSTGENNYGTRIYSQTDTSVDMYQNDDQGGCSVIDDVIALEGTTQANESDFANYTATNTLPFYICIVEGTPITLADYSTKPIEEITYDDNLLVWNFYEGKFDSAKPCWITKPQIAHEYNLCKFNNGIEIGFVGQGGDIGYHRIYNDEAKSFTHTGVKETPIGTHTFAQDNTNPILVEQHIINKPVKFYNIGTQKHINIFANGILTSSRISNKYTIKNMKYVGERLISEQEEKDYISEKLKKG